MFLKIIAQASANQVYKKKNHYCKKYITRLIVKAADSAILQQLQDILPKNYYSTMLKNSKSL